MNLLPFAVLLLGLSSLAQQRMPLDGGWTVARADGGPEIPADVQGAFERYLGTDFDGTAVYRCRHALLDFAAERVRLEFPAVATFAVVRLNGIEVGRHLGGWTPFQVDITQARKAEGNVLEVLVDERVGHNTQGFLPTIQPHFGGIWQGVTICFDEGPVLDRPRVFLFGTADGTLRFDVPVLGADDRTSLRVELYGTGVVSDGPFRGELHLPEPKLWSPRHPRLYPVHLTVRQGERETDFAIVHAGFRSLRADGHRVLWNEHPLQVRGVLHWGYSPPHLAPPTSRDFWKNQLLAFKARGFNCVKCCLWVPPRVFYELCDEIGLLVWQEYPTWHPQIDQAHRQELLDEYAEFFAHDRSHPSVAFRSLTCETGHGADLDVVKALYASCKQAVPETLVVDDSSWIGWQRITDFWDEHPYGNNSWFSERLEEFRKFLAEHEPKPLLLGEGLAGDTWLDRAAWSARFGDAPSDRWHRPICWDAQVEAERWLVDRFGQETLDSLLPGSRRFAMRNRKFQIEQLRMTIPDAGYVVSVARDIPKCRMGLSDDRGEAKWTPDDWSWQGDTMLCLDLPWNARAQSQLSGMSAPVRVSHFGTGTLDGTLRLWVEGTEVSKEVPVHLEPGQVGEPIRLAWKTVDSDLRSFTVRAELEGTHRAVNHWRLWKVPLWNMRGHPEVRETDVLTTEILDELEAGGRVLLYAGERKGSVRTEGMWFLRGAPFAPPHPFHERLSAETLLGLSSFDLESGRVIPWKPWRDQVDPILAFWETHDIPEVRFHLHAFDTRVGKGRLLVTSLRLEPGDGEFPTFAHHVRYLLREHLIYGPASRAALSDETIAVLRASLTERRLDLPEWRFRTDPDDRGINAGYHLPETDDGGEGWRDLRAGAHWEGQGEDLAHYTGIAWYRVAFDLPADWKDATARAVFEGVDDSFECWINGRSIGRFGDPETGKTVWLEPQIVDVTEALRPGARNVVALRVVDHGGAGGLWKPVYLTTGPTGPGADLLR